MLARWSDISPNKADPNGGTRYAVRALLIARTDLKGTQRFTDIAVRAEINFSQSYDSICVTTEVPHHQNQTCHFFRKYRIVFALFSFSAYYID